MAVRGFKTSNFLSIKRLKAIAELRAVIMQASTNKNDFNENVNPSCRANANPMQANGNAKTSSIDERWIRKNKRTNQ